MEKFLFDLYVFFKWICSAVGFVVIITMIYSLLSPAACVSFNSKIFGDFKKEACNHQITKG